MTSAEYDAYVYDLDGTLVELDVDWDAVREAVGAVLRARGVDVAGADLWNMLELADETGYRPLVERKIAEFEREGARTATRLTLADRLPHDEPTAVCSLNCEAAARIALEVFGLDGAVDAIVGRDSHDEEKPHPGPLLDAVEALGATPERTLFVGDSARDAETARRAGTDFASVEEWLDRA
ncbi:MAG: HAD family hydrolase [Haloarculaceae archaeon]